MGSILVAMALLSIYGNIQRARRDEIEKVTITPAAAASPQLTISPTPPTAP
jgi:hypothetical protein